MAWKDYADLQRVQVLLSSGHIVSYERVVETSGSYVFDTGIPKVKMWDVHYDKDIHGDTREYAK